MKLLLVSLGLALLTISCKTSRIDSKTKSLCPTNSSGKSNIFEIIKNDGSEVVISVKGLKKEVL